MNYYYKIIEYSLLFHKLIIFARLASRNEPARLGSLQKRARKRGSARLVRGSRAAPSRAEPAREPRANFPALHRTMVKPNVLPKVKPRVPVVPGITWLRRILYHIRRGQRGAHAPLFGLRRPLVLVACGHHTLLRVLCERSPPSHPLYTHITLQPNKK
jgi:hypothetical protein